MLGILTNLLGEGIGEGGGEGSTSLFRNSSNMTSTMRYKCVETKIEFQTLVLELTYRAYEILTFRTYETIK